MGKAGKPRMNFTLDEESKAYIEEWAKEEGRSVANLLERIALDAIVKKKQVSTDIPEKLGKHRRDRKT